MAKPSSIGAQLVRRRDAELFDDYRLVLRLLARGVISDPLRALACKVRPRALSTAGLNRLFTQATAFEDWPQPSGYDWKMDLC